MATAWTARNEVKEHESTMKLPAFAQEDYYVYFGPGWIRWECPNCNYASNYERTGTGPRRVHMATDVMPMKGERT